MAGRRGNGEGSISKRKAGGYQGRIRYTDPVTGASRRQSVYGKTSDEVRAKIKAINERLEEGAPAKDAKDTVAAWMQRWRTTSLEASDRKPTTKHLYAGLSRKHIETSDMGSTRLDRLRPSHVEGFIVSLRRKGLADSTIRSIYAVLRSALDGAVRDGLLARNPVLQVSRPRVDRDEARVLGAEDVRKVLNACRTSRYYPTVLLLAQTGMRRGEACALRWDDVRMTGEHPELTVTHTLTRIDGKLVASKPKTKRSRRKIPLSPEVVVALRSQRKTQAEERLRAGNQYDTSGDGLVFRTELGTPVDPRNLLRVVETAAKSLGLSGVGAHTLRHSFATALLERGVHIKAVADLLGHGSISITGDLYGHTTPDAARDAIARLGVYEGPTDEEKAPSA